MKKFGDSKKLFENHLDNFSSHEFINSSLYDIDIKKYSNQFDIVHCQGYLCM